MKTPLLLAALLVTASAPLLARDGAPDGTHGLRHGGGIERLDTDADGRISRAEFDAGRAARARMAGHPERKREHAHTPADFAALDANRDGYIVRSEVTAYHERMRPQREAERKARFDERFTAADINKDGKLSRLEVDEKMGRMSERFAWIDENRDGFLSRAELAAGRDRR